MSDNNNDKDRFTLFQLLVWIAMLATGALFGLEGAKRFGGIWAPFLGLLGLFVGYGISWILLRIVYHSLAWIFRIPKCQNCGRRRVLLEEVAEGGFICRCECGAKYLMIRDRFFRLEGDDSQKRVPYMRKNLLGFWVQDRQGINLKTAFEEKGLRP